MRDVGKDRRAGRLGERSPAEPGRSVAAMLRPGQTGVLALFTGDQLRRAFVRGLMLGVAAGLAALLICVDSARAQTPTPTPPPDLVCQVVTFGSAANVALAGSTRVWTNPSNALADDANFSGSSGTLSAGQYTDHLRVSNPSQAGLYDGISVFGVAVRYRPFGSNFHDHAVRVVRSDGTLGAENKATADAWSSSTTPPFYSRGAAWDLWGEGWCFNSSGDCANPAHINLADEDTGFVVSTIATGSGGSPRIYYAEMEVCFTIAGGTPTPTVTPTSTPTPTLTPTPTPTFTLHPEATCAVVPFRTPVAAEAVDGTSTTWTNPNNALVSDNTYATRTWTGGVAQGAYSHYLYWSNLDGSVLDDDIDVIGVEFRYEVKASVSGIIADYIVRARRDDLTFGAENLARQGETFGTSDTVRAFGGPTNVLGEGWCFNSSGDCADPSHINLADQDTGFVVSVWKAVASGSGVTISVDHAEMEVCFLAAGIATPTHTETSTPSVTPTPTDTTTPSGPTPTPTPSPYAPRSHLLYSPPESWAYDGRFCRGPRLVRPGEVPLRAAVCDSTGGTIRDDVTLPEGYDGGAIAVSASAYKLASSDSTGTLALGCRAACAPAESGAVAAYGELSRAGVSVGGIAQGERIEVDLPEQTPGGTCEPGGQLYVQCGPVASPLPPSAYPLGPLTIGVTLDHPLDRIAAPAETLWTDVASCTGPVSLRFGGVETHVVSCRSVGGRVQAAGELPPEGVGETVRVRVSSYVLRAAADAEAALAWSCRAACFVGGDTVTDVFGTEEQAGVDGLDDASPYDRVSVVTAPLTPAGNCAPLGQLWVECTLIEAPDRPELYPLAGLEIIP